MFTSTNPQSQSKWHDPKVIISLLAILLIGAIVIVSILRDRIVNAPNWQIQVTGQGKVPYQPDSAVVTLGVKIDKMTKAEDALSALNQKIAPVYSALETIGIPKSAITTQNYTIYPEYDVPEGVSRLSGYTAEQLLSVKVEGLLGDPAKVAKVIAAASMSGANQISGVTFESSKLQDIKQEARLNAIADAQKKSQELAKALNVELGEVVGWWENVIVSPDMYSTYGKGYGIGGGGEVPSLPSGTEEVVIEVNVSYLLK